MPSRTPTPRRPPAVIDPEDEQLQKLAVLPGVYLDSTPFDKPPVTDPAGQPVMKALLSSVHAENFFAASPATRSVGAYRDVARDMAVGNVA